MAIEKLSAAAPPDGVAIRGTRFPGNDLRVCLEVPRLLNIKGGGLAAPDQMAAYLGYKGTNNGAYLTKVAAATSFDLISKVGPVFRATALAHKILSPTYPQDGKRALIEAFMNVPLFKRIYEDFKGKELPPEPGMKNALGLQYGVAANRVSDAYRSLMDSADTAGFFETKNGARTHLIFPLIQPVIGATASVRNLDNPKDDVGSNAVSDTYATDTTRASAPTPYLVAGDAKEKYLSALITLFEERAAKGEMDEKLMERIERLLGAPAGNA